MILNSKKISFFSLLIIMPIFLTFYTNGQISMSRLGGHDKFGFTIPISLIFIIPTIFFYIIRNYQNKEFLIYMVFILSVSILQYNIGFESRNLLLVLMISLFISSVFGFEKYFFARLEYQEKDLYYIINPMMFVLFLSLASVYLYSSESFLLPDIVIYNYYQYFSFIFLLLIGILSDRKMFVRLLIASLLSLLISYNSENFTSLLLNVFLILYFLGWYKLSKRNFIQFNHNLIILLVFASISYHFFVLLFGDMIIEFMPINIKIRFALILEFYESLPYKLYPIFPSGDLYSIEYHNEMLIILSAMGVLGVLMYIYLFLKRLLYINKYFPFFSTSLTLFVFIGGIFVNPVLHLYTAMIIAYLLSYFYVSSFMIKNSG